MVLVRIKHRQPHGGVGANQTQYLVRGYDDWDLRFNSLVTKKCTLCMHPVSA
jgi:hypothetical protein